MNDGYECGLAYSTNSEVNGPVMHDVRGILVAINMFPTVDEFMKFVEETLELHPKRLPDSLTDQKSQYEVFLELPINEAMINPNQMICCVYAVYKLLYSKPKNIEVS